MFSHRFGITWVGTFNSLNTSSGLLEEVFESKKAEPAQVPLFHL